MKQTFFYILTFFFTFLLFSCAPGITKELGVTLLSDRDRDNLPDSVERLHGTNTMSTDSDGDGLSDYEELQKYKTDPLAFDSDGDRVGDADWNERKEYTLTITAVVDLRPPFDLSAMNDFYQDARIVENSGEVTRFEVILYPEAKPLFNLPGTSGPDMGFQQPTFAKNYTHEMSQKGRSIRKRAGNDYEAVWTLINFTNDFTYIKQKDFGYPTDLPVLFNFYRENDNSDRIALANLPENLDSELLESIIDRFYKADRIYREKASGSCGPRAIMRGAMLRAAGFPERTTFAIPLVYTYRADNTLINISDTYRIESRENLDGDAVANHLYNEVFLGNQWVRVDYQIDPGIRVYKKAPYIKILSMDQMADYNFPVYWNYKTWQKKRPFKYISIIEQQPRR